MSRRRYAMFVTPKHQDWPLVINLVNSIVGVSLLVMPFCFQKCGILLGILLLAFSTWLTYVSCYILVKAAVIAKARSYEHLASQTLGRLGKLSVEISVVGVQLGVAVAIFVVIGDLASEMLCQVAGLPHSTPPLRALMVAALALGVTLPLSLQRDLSNLHHTNVASTVFYIAIVAGIVISSFPSLHANEWAGHVSYWKTDYAFECLPIFALSYACQMQMFVIYESMPDPTLSRMKHVTFTGIVLCMVAYSIVGVFGYIAYWHLDINGNVLLSLTPSALLTVIVKLGFVLSMLLSFPLIVFPCRESLNSLLCYGAMSGSHDEDHCNGNSLPHPMGASRLRGFTLFIILFTLIVAIVFPNVEFILALTGATMGSTVGFILPPLLYLKVADLKPGLKPRDCRRAKAVLICGVLTLCISTHQTLFNMSSQSTADIDETRIAKEPQLKGPPRADSSGSAEEHGRLLNPNRAEAEPPDPPLLADGGKQVANVVAALPDARPQDALIPDRVKLRDRSADSQVLVVDGGDIPAVRAADDSEWKNRGLVQGPAAPRSGSASDRSRAESNEVAAGEAGVAAIAEPAARPVPASPAAAASPTTEVPAGNKVTPAAANLPQPVAAVPANEGAAEQAGDIGSALPRQKRQKANWRSAGKL